MSNMRSLRRRSAYRSTKSDTPLVVSVQLPFGGGDQVSGSVSNADWLATLLGYRAATGTAVAMRRTRVRR